MKDFIVKMNRKAIKRKHGSFKNPIKKSKIYIIGNIRNSYQYKELLWFNKKKKEANRKLGKEHKEKNKCLLKIDWLRGRVGKGCWKLGGRLRHQLKSHYWIVGMWSLGKYLLLWRKSMCCESFWPSGYRSLHSCTVSGVLHLRRTMVSNTLFSRHLPSILIQSLYKSSSSLDFLIKSFTHPVLWLIPLFSDHLGSRK